MNDDIFLLIGLGNYGSQYDKTRHNIGFEVIDRIRSDYNISTEKLKFNGLISEIKISNNRLILVKPQTYMNNSGICARLILDYYKIPIANVMVFHDDIDLQVGKVKFKQGGGSAGHNGLKSLDNHIGSQYYRVRIGVGHPGDRDLVSQYVLQKFSNDDFISCVTQIDRIINNIELFFDQKITLFQQAITN